MFSLPRPDAIFTHESDLDGLVAGVLLQRLARKLHGGEVPLYAYHYNGWRQRDLRERVAWVADLTFEARMDKAGWVTIDHHTTEALPKFSHLIHDVNKSAARLCYELCQQQGLGSPALDRLLHLNDVADLFLEDDPDFILASDYASLVKVYGFWSLHTLVQGEIERLLDHPLLEVMAAKRRIEDPIGYEWSRQNVTEITPEVGFVDTVVGNTNLIVHRLLESQATPYPVLVTLARRGVGNVFLSVRSRNGGALPIALRLHGGGHANACGATLPRSVKTNADALEYLRGVLLPRKEPALNSLESLFDGLELAKT